MSKIFSRGIFKGNQDIYPFFFFILLKGGCAFILFYADTLTKFRLNLQMCPLVAFHMSNTIFFSHHVSYMNPLPPSLCWWFLDEGCGGLINFKVIRLDKWINPRALWV